MRTLKFTHQQIEILLRSLGIAEAKFNELRNNYIKSVVNVRGTDTIATARMEADPMFEKANEIYDLLALIKDGSLDV